MTAAVTATSAPAKTAEMLYSLSCSTAQSARAAYFTMSNGNPISAKRKPGACGFRSAAMTKSPNSFAVRTAGICMGPAARIRIPFFINPSSNPESQESSVHDQRRAGGEGGRIGGEVHGPAHQLVHISKTLHGSVAQNGFAARRIRKRLGVERRLKIARNDCIHTHTQRRPLHRQTLRECDDTGFAGAIRCRVGERDERTEGCHVHN